jgi:hypothetical protein
MQGWFQNHMFFSSKIMLSGRFSSFVFLSLGHGIFSMKYLIRKIICILLNRKTIFAKKRIYKTYQNENNSLSYPPRLAHNIKREIWVGEGPAAQL